MTLGLVGKKLGMTRQFFDSGISIPVTVVKVEKGRVHGMLSCMTGARYVKNH